MTTIHTDWKWYGGSHDEWYSVGPCDTLAELLSEMRADGYEVAHIVQATYPPVRLADYLPDVLECASERFADSDLAHLECDDCPFERVTIAQGEDLEARVAQVCDEWQATHGLVFSAQMFGATRGHDFLILDDYDTGAAIPTVHLAECPEPPAYLNPGHGIGYGRGDPALSDYHDVFVVGLFRIVVRWMTDYHHVDPSACLRLF